MYVDNILLFTKTNLKSLRGINNILEEFSIFSSLEINRKNSAIFSKVCALCNTDLHNILGFTVTPFPSCTLVCPLIGSNPISNVGC